MRAYIKFIDDNVEVDKVAERWNIKQQQKSEAKWRKSGNDSSTENRYKQKTMAAGAASSVVGIFA